ncbi:Gfo/Idh/MocA family protein [Acetatifactor aquisgranensis]|uniref:Gfo/Idh/MocA family protein n=1 Tax=Acetatifactor aquisgranensis TaxID=2941233 RepID=UPI0023B9C201|nr:Gfo/Idh/MocA family oxidoreductase [Acetatifactor aquisgranensis]
MYKVAILGCENSHANFFLEYFVEKKVVGDVEVMGVYSDDAEAARKLQAQFGVNVMEHYDDFVGKLDGLIITARHGDNHYKYAKPYLGDGIPMFIDKPITVSEKDAREFRRELEENRIPVSGGSMCMYDGLVQELKKAVEDRTYGVVYGGSLRSPVSLDNIYGGFYFYSQHLVQVLGEIFGYYPRSVQAFPGKNAYTCVFRYEGYDVTGVYVEGNYTYYAGISCEKEYVGGMYALENCAEREVEAFYRILTGGSQEMSYEDFFAPVYILNAIHRSVQSGKEEAISF